MNMYRERLLDNYNNPQNYGVLDDATSSHSLENISCGDNIKIYLKVNSDDIIEDVSFEGDGCAIAIASASILTTNIKGKKSSEILALTIDDLVEMLGVSLTVSRLKCANLSLETVKVALAERNKSN